ncbi:helix-turn-helix domain-containing protein [Stakelama marina]|uniref:ImmA/IrrE family metallo-endopeptidase n=1 Tax=Stakelama marina TaxID=2826939 RepID=A0A8T4I8S5_9SPHN|nr:ImmA/IrrE family metallo-endopeptidase [Stakelama marina]MBR0551057.1 ImmA/IrrE family metallo-endopeptidase [Stakelama marina]
MFNPARLSLARHRAGLSKSQLAEAARVSRPALHRYETGATEPAEDITDRIANVLGYPAAFFYGETVDHPPRDAASFRSMSHMLAADRDAALAAGSLAFMLSDWVENLFDLPPVDLHDLSDERTPDHAARALRELWGLGEKPIRNMVHLLEAKGVRVFSLVEETRSVDAFSVWRSNKPYIFLNTVKTAEHSRFDAAHELGHLVLHKHGGPGGRAAEDEANRFASSFLMPSADVRARMPIVRGLNHIIAEKARWKVSVAALNYRLRQLGITTEWENRQLCIQIARNGYRTTEPQGIEREMSVVWEKVFGGLRNERITKHDISAALHIPATEIDKIVFGLTRMMSIEGGRQGFASSARGKLSLVSG